MVNTQIGIQNNYSASTKSSSTCVINNEAIVDGVKMPPCPAKGRNLTMINNKVYIDGYETVNGKWKKTLKALWYKWF